MIYTDDEAKQKSTEYFNGDTLAADAFLSKYALRNEKEELLESTPKDMHKRLAREFARIEKNKYDARSYINNENEFETKFNNPLSEDFIFQLFNKFKYLIPQGSPSAAIGNDYLYQSLGNCFTLGEHPYDSYAGILYADQMLVQLSKRRCGVGLSLDKIRPKGLPTKNAARTTDGIGVFMQRFSNSTREVAQSGRRGALLQGLSVHHPEIETFINIKRDLTKVTGANISVVLTDEFMLAVKNNEEYEQRWPVEGSKPVITKKVKAKTIWNQIIDAAWSSAEPGLLFIDRARQYGLAHQYGVKDVRFKDIITNPSLEGNTKVWTDRGIFPIKKLVNKTINVKNINGDVVSAYCSFSGKKQLYKITFTNNQTVYCTGEHQWPVLNTSGHIINPQNGRILKQTTDKLTAGYKVYFPFNNNLSFGEEKLSEKEGFIVGWSLGDGWKSYHKTQKTYQRGFVFAQEEYYIGEKVLNYTNSLAKIKSNLRQDHDTKSYTYCTTDSKVLDNFNRLGNPNKKEGLPKTIWTNGLPFIKGVIDGLFSSDGSITVRNKLTTSTITLTSVHQKLVKDVRKLLSFFGIKSNIFKSKNKSKFPKYNSNPDKIYIRYDLVISGIHCNKFTETFNLSSKSKQKKLEEIFLKDNTSYKNNREYLLIKSVEKTSLKRDTFDITVNDNTNTFLTEVGITGNCGELWIGLDSCRLFLINLYSYVKNPFSDNPEFDYKLFDIHSQIAQRLMDDMVDLEIEKINKIIEKVKSDPEPEHIKKIELDMWENYLETAKLGRRTGLGITALGDCLAALNIKYGSNKSIEVTEEIYKQLAISSMKSSCLMAEQLGSFPLYDSKLEKNHPFLENLFKSSPEVESLHKKYGRRNISLTTTAPAGTVSLLTQTTSGIEPVFLLQYKRRRKISSDSKKYDFIDASGDKWEEYIVNHHHLKTWMDVTGKADIQESPYWEATSNDVNWEKSVDIQAAAQKWISHSISKTCNIPKESSKELVSKIYLQAWEKGCKGFTIYRDGCRDGVLVSLDEKKETAIKYNDAPKRPKELECNVYHISKNNQPYFVLVGFLNNGSIYEVFAGKNTNDAVHKSIKKGKVIKRARGKYKAIFDDGSELSPLKAFIDQEEEVLTRMISMCLRHGTKLEYILHQLEKSSGGLQSMAKAISKALKNCIEDGTIITGEECPECGEKLLRKEGCKSCSSCSYSAC